MRVAASKDRYSVCSSTACARIFRICFTATCTWASRSAARTGPPTSLDSSPAAVTKFIDGATEGMEAREWGALPCSSTSHRKPEAFKLTGSYQLVDNEIKADADAPPFSHVNGEIQFTESGIAVRSLPRSCSGSGNAVSGDSCDARSR